MVYNDREWGSFPPDGVKAQPCPRPLRTSPAEALEYLVLTSRKVQTALSAFAVLSGGGHRCFCEVGWSGVVSMSSLQLGCSFPGPLGRETWISLTLLSLCPLTLLGDYCLAFHLHIWDTGAERNPGIHHCVAPLAPISHQSASSLP